VHAIVLAPANGLPDAVARTLTAATHGHLDEIGNASPLRDKLLSIATEIAKDSAP
jgi:hypothetical protein